MVSGVELLDAVTAAGSANRANEDGWGARGRVVWVIDGATGLGDSPLLDAPSDAAWLASRMNAAFGELADAGQDDPQRILATAAERIAAAFAAERTRSPEQRYEIPTAAVLLAVFHDMYVDIAELGDCRIYVRPGNDAIVEAGGTAHGRALERANADRVATGASTLRTPAVLELLREVRNRANTDAGYWVFAPDPEPVRRSRRHRLGWGSGAHALFATDGFDALCEDYRRYSPADLLAAARARGLAPLIDELRGIERVEDPQRTAYPRFKVSDDATAVLVAAAG